MTIHGEMQEDALTKKEYTEDRNGNKVHATEYWFNEELVHRSVHVELAPLSVGAVQGVIG